MTVYAGIDLAWSGRKPTGVCVLRSAGSDNVTVERIDCMDGDASAVFGVLATLGPDVVAGIDGPLVVGENRRAEAELARAFGNRGVYAYAARQDFLERHGIVEGPRLGSVLASNGWNLDPSRHERSGLHALEVFPHATIVSLLGAERALRYKKGRLDSRMGPLREFQARLFAYASANLPGLARTAGLLTEPIERVPGKELKSLEDRLDAVACAIAAYHWHRHGAAGTRLFGSVEQGYIAVPHPV